MFEKSSAWARVTCQWQLLCLPHLPDKTVLFSYFNSLNSSKVLPVPVSETVEAENRKFNETVHNILVINYRASLLSIKPYILAEVWVVMFSRKGKCNYRKISKCKLKSFETEISSLVKYKYTVTKNISRWMCTWN